jgi:LuxR family transcriptional regulator, maltose regulon positive regulatory protein
MITALRTKTTIPPISPRVIKRPRLVQCLQDGIQRALTTLVAPAGFGKTTLATAWAQTCQMPVAWLSLQPADRSEARFLAYLIQALQTIDERLGQTTLALLRAGASDAALFALVNDLTKVEHDFALVLDDYHNADCEPITQMIQFLLENRPATFHLVIISRVEPALNLTRLRALDQVIEITEADLRFTSAEMGVFFDASMGLELTAEDLDHLERSTEGWAVGMQLAALTKLRQPPAWPATPGQAYIFDYLAEEVLQHEPPEVQDFLKKSASFDRFCVALCAYAFNSDHEGNGLHERYQELIAYLDRANLFLVPLDSTGVWHRYHGLFSDFLRRQLSPQQARRMYRRASLWFETNDFRDEAIQYAMQAEDFERAADLLEKWYFDLLAQGEQYTITEWIAALPNEILERRPRLWLAKGWASIINLNRIEAKICIERVEASLPAGQTGGRLDNEVQSLRILTTIFSGEMVEAEEISAIIRSLSKEEDFLRSLLFFNLGSSHMFTGDAGQAALALREAVRWSQAMNNPLMVIMAQATLGENLQMVGKLVQAEQTFLDAIRFAKENLGEHTFLLGYVYNNYSDLLREQNRFDEAFHYAEMGISYCLVWQPVASLDSQIVLARLLASQSKWQESFKRLELARQTMAESGLDIADIYINIHMIRLMLLQGNLERARHEIKASQLEESYESMLPTVQGFFNMVFYRYKTMELVANHSAVHSLIDPLAKIIERAEQKQQITYMVESLILLAYVQDSAGESSAASRSLEKALSMGAHNGYVRLFVDEGVRLLTLLEKYRPQIHAPHPYIEKIVGHLRQESARSTRAAPPSLEGLTSLTRREIDILSLLALGKSNQEIADLRVLALGTVKKHVANILSKLGVANRTQAVLLAKKVGWLE